MIVPPGTRPGEHTIRVLANTVSSGPEIASASFRVTGPAEPCVGDANGDGTVSINELVLGVTIALGTHGIDAAPIFDTNGSETVEINELVIAARNALQGCPSALPAEIIQTAAY